jgi:hypothetical protein
MQVDASTFRAIAAACGMQERAEVGYRDNAILRLETGEAQAIVELARLAASADDIDDGDESELVEALATHLLALGPDAAPPPAEPSGGDRITRLRELAGTLRGRPAGTLALALVYLVTVADMNVVPEEDEVVDVVREAIGMGEHDAQELLGQVAELVTPSA